MKSGTTGNSTVKSVVNVQPADSIDLSSPDRAFTKDYITPYIPQWMTHLRDFIGKPNVRFLEVGSFEGCTALWFLDNILTDESSSITCVDFFETPEYEARFDHNVAVSGHSHRLEKIKGRSQDILPGFVGNRLYDAIYIDGGHTAEEVYVDAALCWQLLKPGGVVAFDDYEWRLHRPLPDRPQVGIDKFLDEHRDDLTVLHKEYTVLARRNP